MKTKFYSILTALTMLVPTFATVAKADDPPATSSSGYYKFEEDFSEYDENNSQTVEWPTWETDNGLGKVVATREDGTKWVCSTYWVGGPTGKSGARVKIDPDTDAMQLKSWGDYMVMVYLDNPDTFEINEVQRIKFKTQRSQRHHGMAMFVNQSTKQYIYFGQSNGGYGAYTNGVSYIPFVALVSGDQAVAREFDATNAAGFTNGDNTLEWEIEIEGTYMNWTATSGMGKKWSGSMNVPESYFKGYEYFGGFIGVGDGFGKLENFSYETGAYYTPEIGEPKEVIYRDLYSTATDVTSEFNLAEDDTHKIYKFEEAAPVRRIVSANKYGDIELSADGVTFDKFDMSSTMNIVNTDTLTEYRYVKLPEKPTKNFKLYTQVKSGDTVTVRKGENIEIPLYKEGKTSTPDWISSDINYLVTDGKTLTAKKEGTVQATFKGDKEDYVINVNIEGPLSDALKAQEKGDNVPMLAYIATQQEILNVLNTAITNNDITAVQNFFGTTEANTLNDMDLIDSKPFTEVKMSTPLKFRDFAERILTYKDGFKCSSSLDEIEEAENQFVKELTVGKIEGLTYGDAVTEALEANNDVLELDLSDKYYKDLKKDITLALVNAKFANYADLKQRLSESTVLVNIQNTIGTDFVNEILTDFAEAIGYNETHYNSISDKKTFGNALISARGTFNNIADVRNYIDTYSASASATPTPKPGGTGGSGGSGGGGGIKNNNPKTEYVDTKGEQDKNDKTKEDPAVDGAQLFADIPTDHWCYEAIRYLRAKEAVDGYDDGTFMPNNDVTRAEFIKMLIGIFASDTELAEDFVSQFADLNGDEWYYESMAKAEQLGILQGTDGKCNPTGKITRQEMAVITYRMLEKAGKTLKDDTEIEIFADENEIASWARSIVMKMQAAGIISGTDGKFMPNGEATRAMAAQVLYKAVSSFEEKSE